MRLVRLLAYALCVLTCFSYFMGFFLDLNQFSARQSQQASYYWLPSPLTAQQEVLRGTKKDKSLVQRVVETVVPDDLLVHRTLDVFLTDEEEDDEETNAADAASEDESGKDETPNVEAVAPVEKKFEEAQSVTADKKTKEVQSSTAEEKQEETPPAGETEEKKKVTPALATEQNSEEPQKAIDEEKEEPKDDNELRGAAKSKAEHHPPDTTPAVGGETKEEATAVTSVPDFDEEHPLFVVLGDSRSGAEWLMSVLHQHPQTCVPNPVGVLMPSGFPWLDDSNPEKGCTFTFVRDQVSQVDRRRCTAEYQESEEGKKDPLQANLPRICQFVNKLDGNYSEEAILGLWTDLLLGREETVGRDSCRCPENTDQTTAIRGLKVLSEWADQIPALQTNKAVARSKIIRLRRNNLWARYMSVVLAEKSDIWSVASAADRDRRLDAVKEPFAVSIDDMLEQFGYMVEQDSKADRLAEGHQTLWLEYEECLSDVPECFRRIYGFLGVDQKHITEHSDIYTTSVPSSNSDRLLEKVSNADHVREALGANGMGAFIGMTDYAEIQHLIYEPSSGLVRTAERRPGINMTLVHQEFGPKYTATQQILQSLPPDALSVVSNGFDGGINHHIRSKEKMYSALARARQAFQELTKDRPGAIVVSATDQCCASALTHTSPGDLFDANGKRKGRACKSGAADCQWRGDDNAASAWQTLMKETAARHSPGVAEHVYLGASFMAGKAADLSKLLAALDIDAATEDERAVLSDYMYYKADSIVLDYEQKIFGKGFDGVRSKKNEQCPLVDSSKRHNLIELNGPKSPMFVFSARDLGCTNATSSNALQSYPVWDEPGIQLKPIIDQIDVLNEKDASLSGIDRHFGPEILYVVDEKGLWTSGRIQGRINNDTSHFRVKPTEELLFLAYRILSMTRPGSSRWKALQRNMAEGGFPFYGFYGDFKACNYNNAPGGESVPVFTTCAIAGCNHAFPMPAYMTMIDSQNSTANWHKVFRQFDMDFPWEKKIRKVVWRGALSENNPKKVFSSARWRLCEKAHSLGSDYYDVGLVNIPQFLKDQLGDIDVTPVGGLKKGISPMNDFQQYLAVMDLDGNSWSSRFGTLLCYNSVAVKVEPKYYDYFFYDLQPWKHYVPIKDDLSDLEENIAFIMNPQNEAVVKEIIATANQWCSERFVYAELARDVLDIWENYIERLDRADPNWTKSWAKKKEQVFHSNLDMSLVQQSSEFV